MHESTGGLPTLLKDHLPVPRDGGRSAGGLSARASLRGLINSPGTTTGRPGAATPPHGRRLNVAIPAAELCDCTRVLCYKINPSKITFANRVNRDIRQWSHTHD